MIRRIKSLFSPSKKFSFYTNDNITPSKQVSIGKYTYGVPIITPYDSETKLIIGNFCSIADNVKLILGGNHRTEWATTYPFSVINEDFPNGKSIVGHPVSKGDLIIENDVWIGHSAIILSGITISNGAVIAAGSLITKNIGPYEIWGGNPAKLIRKRFSDEQIKDILQVAWWNWPISKINEHVHLLCSSDIQSLLNVK